MQHIIFPLQLPDNQLVNLKEQYQVLDKKLEKIGTLRPEMLVDLIATMKQILAKQPQYLEAKTQARNEQTTLHLTHDDPTILNLPWRLATQDYPLLFLTKGKPTTGDLPILEADNPPLKILVMIASPENADYDSRLDYEAEEDQIIKAFEPLFDLGQVQIDFTDDGSPENLAEKLAANRYHIVHFSGHGIYRDGIGYLALEDAQTMRQNLVKAEKFAQVFQQKPEHQPALVVLSSCQTAKGGTELGMQSVADELLLKGLPAVIAMNVSVTDYFATYFASSLYQFLAKKEPLFRAFQKAIAAVRQAEQQLIKNSLPSQWMIPQLLVSKRIGQPVDFAKADQNLRYSAWKFVSGQEGLQTAKRENYQFVGRRIDRKRIFQSLAKNSSVLLKGQGGVGKTAMAEYILQRLVAKDARVHPFIFNEYTASITNIIAELEKFLKTKKQRKRVLNLRTAHEGDAFVHFEYLFAEVEQHCSPLFIFDNLESFQSEPGQPFRPEYAEGLTKIIKMCYEEDLPLVLTCRYSVAECPDIPTYDLNQVSRNDFLKKALQLSLATLPKKLKQQKLAHLLQAQQLTFRKVIGWLHETFGGNYRALEFFDQLYTEKNSKLPDAIKTLADFKAEYADQEAATRQKMSKNLLFEELLQLLDADEKTTLRLLCRFRIPVLVTALQMQQHELNYPDLLAALRELTLLEQQIDLAQPELAYFYVTPLVKELVEGAYREEGAVEFLQEQAGRYHQWMVKEINKQSYQDLEEAFAFYLEVKNGEALNETGDILTNFYYNTSQFHSAIQYGLVVYEITQKETNWYILNTIGYVFHLYGKREKTLFFFELCYEKAKEEAHLKNQGTALNNISQIYSAQGDYETALKYLKQALIIRKDTGDKQGESTTLGNLGTVSYIKGDYKLALQYFQQGLKICQDIGDKKGEGTTLNNISQIYSAQGDYETALKYLKQALIIQKDIGDKKGEGATLSNISQIYDARGDDETALKYLKQALIIQKDIGDKKGEGATLNNMATTAHALGDDETAFKYLKQSLIIRKDIGDKQGEGTTLNNISQIYKARGDYETALKYLKQSLIIRKDIGDINGVAITLYNMGAMLFEQNLYQRAFPMLMESYQIFKKIGSPNVKAPESYLSAIIEKVGEAQIEKWLNQ